VRARIIKKSEEEFQIIITSHHLVCDGWSIDVVVKDIGALYTAKRQGVYIQLKEPYNFSQYALLLEAKEEKGENEKALAFWKEKFSGEAPVLDLPTDQPRPNFRSFKAKRIDKVLEPELLQGLRQVSGRTGCTLVTVMLAAFKVFLSRLSGQEDIIVGLPAAGQIAAGQIAAGQIAAGQIAAGQIAAGQIAAGQIAAGQAAVGWNELVGHCVNLLPLRSQPRGNQLFSAYLKQLRSVMLDAYENQQLTFGQLLPELNLTRDPSRIPLVAAIFNIDMGIDLKGMKFADHEVNFFANPREFENFEIYLNVSPAKKTGFVLEWTFNTALFHPESMKRRIEEFETLLNGIVQNTEEYIYKLPLLTTEEQSLLYSDWNKTEKAFSKEKTLHQLFQEQAQRTPDQPALVFDNETFTYRELNNRANQLAHFLKRQNLKQEACVALLMERSPQMIISLLAILKAGLAYIPIDPVYPTERIAFILSDCLAKLMLTQKKFKKQLQSGSCEFLCVDELSSQIEQEPLNNPAPTSGPHNLAYIIYTSGSTGKPKGVAIEHHSPVALVDWAQDIYTQEDLKGVLASTSICFDLSIFEIFVPLTAGGCIILAKDILELPHMQNRSKLTLLNTVPSAMIELLRFGALPASIRTVNLAGEPLPAALADKIYATGTVKQVFDLYGPTEDTTYSTFMLRKPQGIVSIGRPINNTKIYILDKHLQPVPIGVKGEICLSGEGLARGYLNRPELTAELFITRPLQGTTPVRFYRTGDMARYLADGNIEYLGRMDNQIKLRGFRIELNEIASMLADYKGVKQQVVMVKEVQPQNKGIIAYLVIDPAYKQNFTTENLHQYLRTKLPEYMIPTHFMVLDELPLTPNGKIDHHQLPVPFLEQQIDYQAPRNDKEKAMEKIWTKVLERKQVGITEIFFKIGGHSLLATQLIAEINKEYDLQLPLRILFTEPTIAELTQFIAAKKYCEKQKIVIQDKEREVVIF
jgi:amino acid adenylation domain-containing protein